MLELDIPTPIKPIRLLLGKELTITILLLLYYYYYYYCYIVRAWLLYKVNLQ